MRRLVFSGDQASSDHFRRALVRRFPFEVFYEFDDTRVIVHLVFHTSQDPAKWRARLGLI